MKSTRGDTMTLDEIMKKEYARIKYGPKGNIDESTSEGFDNRLIKEEGQKDDGDKVRYDLIPAEALHELARVLTFGAKKYGPENWRKVPDAEARYFAAAMRHLWAWKRGEDLDPESRLSHLGHALCCVSFLLEMDIDECNW